MPGDWRPSIDGELLRARADCFAQVRDFFRNRGVLEVDTPALSRHATCDPNIDSFRVGSGNNTFFLQTSPEFFMKRLLAAGSGDIYSICRVYRDEEAGRHHNPEFVMLEWYRLGADVEGMARETTELLKLLTGADCSRESPGRTYTEAFLQYAGIDPIQATTDELKQVAGKIGLDCSDLNRDSLLDAIASICVYPELGLGGLEVVTAYPASQAALAEINAEDPAVANRFEIFLQGLELANGFQELRDAEEQRQRFMADNDKRRELKQPEMPIDHHLLEALAHGLPACSGVAVGLDRVLMLALGKRTLAEVMPFPLNRC